MCGNRSIFLWLAYALCRMLVRCSSFVAVIPMSEIQCWIASSASAVLKPLINCLLRILYRVCKFAAPNNTCFCVSLSPVCDVFHDTPYLCSLFPLFYISSFKVDLQHISSIESLFPIFYWSACWPQYVAEP